MKTKVTKEEGQIIVAFTGRLDTPAAQEVNPVINPLLEEADKTIILDCKEMSYISSSGLRIFLTLRKQDHHPEHQRRHPLCVYDDRLP